MLPEDCVDDAIDAVLDGRSLPSLDGLNSAQLRDPLRLIEAIGRAHRLALFGDSGPLEPPQRSHWGPLQIRAEIGRGTSGTVYRAWDPRLARETALKLLTGDVDPDAALREGQLLARLNHPHIVRVFGADVHDGVAGIWMELLEGETLDTILERDGLFGSDEVLAIGADLARALAAVHSAGLLHRDVKARNVIRERGGRVVLMDLSAGRLSDGTAAGANEAGTPLYMAPEVLAGSPASERSDVYALGVLLFRLLTATFPVTASSGSGLRAAHTEARRSSLRTLRPDIASEVAAVIEQGCASDPAARFGNAAAFEAAIAGALRHVQQQRAKPAMPLTRFWTHWRTRLGVGVAGLIAAGTIVAIGWNMSAGRAVRRSLGLAVPPRSPLYVTMMGAVGIVRDGRLSLIPGNPHWASVLSVSHDLGVVTRTGTNTWRYGARFRLDGTPDTPPAPAQGDLCCFLDGTTDGRYNYAPRTEYTVEEPATPRRSTPGVYRFDRDWTNPERYFDLAPAGAYLGIAYAGDTDTFWLVRVASPAGAAIEEWSRDGRRLSTPVKDLAGSNLRGISLDPLDGTLWVIQDLGASDVVRFQNFDRSGRYLGSFELPRLSRGIVVTTDAAEFAWGPTR